ncbi:MAG: hypothetical protein JSW00_03675 [Thermoplasmata archaeon]|nr:MAG: hypothetical protein JSW00_03675 [Thermoplasmata archaeon]
MKKNRRRQLQEGGGYVIGMAIGMPTFIFFAFIINNFPLGVAWLTSGFAVGMTLEEEQNSHLTIKQKKAAILSSIIGVIVFVITIALLWSYYF